MELFIFLFLMMITGMLIGSIMTYLGLNRLYERERQTLVDMLTAKPLEVTRTTTMPLKDVKATVVTHLTPEQREKQKNKILMDTEEEMDKLFKSVIQ